MSDRRRVVRRSWAAVTCPRFSYLELFVIFTVVNVVMGLIR